MAPARSSRTFLLWRRARRLTVVVTMGFGVVGVMNGVKGWQPGGGPLARVRWEGAYVRDAVGCLIARKFPMRALV
jgi:hypothetical protein